jgi:hypothetical protein
VTIGCALLARPTPGSLALGAGTAACGLVVRGLAASRLAKHEGLLTTGGPYALTRHPLYLGSAVVASGLLAAAHSWLGAVLGATYFAVFYPAAIRREERKLHARYGSAYVEYAARVPPFWPRFGLSRPVRLEWSWALYRRNGEYQSAAGVLLAVTLLWLKMHLHA